MQKGPMKWFSWLIGGRAEDEPAKSSKELNAETVYKRERDRLASSIVEHRSLRAKVEGIGTEIREALGSDAGQEEQRAED